MPARPPVPQVVQIVTEFTLGEDLRVINRFFQKYSTAGPLSDAGAIAWATACATSWNTHLAPSTAAECTLTGVTITDLSSDLGVEDTVLVSHPGTGAGSGVTAGVAWVVKCHIARRYRGGHPRQYMAGLPISALADPQSMTPATAAALATDYASFRTDTAAGAPTALQPATDVNVSYFQGFTNHTFPSGRVRPIPNLRSTPLVDQIAAFSVNPHLASQRRRNLQST